jgi:hypothetical protein
MSVALMTLLPCSYPRPKVAPQDKLFAATLVYYYLHLGGVNDFESCSAHLLRLNMTSQFQEHLPIRSSPRRLRVTKTILSQALPVALCSWGLFLLTARQTGKRAFTTSAIDWSEALCFAVLSSIQPKKLKPRYIAQLFVQAMQPIATNVVLTIRLHGVLQLVKLFIIKPCQIEGLWMTFLRSSFHRVNLLIEAKKFTERSMAKAEWSLTTRPREQLY